MPFQSTVNINQGAGLIGTLYLDGPVRARTMIIDSVGTTPAFNRVARAFTQVSGADNHATVGGAIGDGTPFAGILANPVEQALYGSLAGSLAPSLDFPQYANASFVRMGQLWIPLATAANIGDLLDYVIATGVIVNRAPSVANPVGGNANIPNATVDYFNLSGAGITVARITE